MKVWPSSGRQTDRRKDGNPGVAGGVGHPFVGAVKSRILTGGRVDRMRHHSRRLRPASSDVDVWGEVMRTAWARHTAAPRQRCHAGWGEVRALGAAARGHRGVESRLRRALGIAFREGESCAREASARRPSSTMRRTGLEPAQGGANDQGQNPRQAAAGSLVERLCAQGAAGFVCDCPVGEGRPNTSPSDPRHRPAARRGRTGRSSRERLAGRAPRGSGSCRRCAG